MGLFSRHFYSIHFGNNFGLESIRKKMFLGLG